MTTIPLTRMRVCARSIHCTTKRLCTRVNGFLAGVCYEDAGLDFDEAYNSVSDLPPEDIEQFEHDLWEGNRMRIVFGNKVLTVLDCFADAGKEGEPTNDVATRSLYFNQRPDLVQSSVYIDRETSTVLHHLPPPRHGETSTEVQGLCFGVALHSMTHGNYLQQQADGVVHEGDLNISILGAGAGSLVGFLAAAPRLPRTGEFLFVLAAIVPIILTRAVGVHV